MSASSRLGTYLVRVALRLRGRAREVPGRYPGLGSLGLLLGHLHERLPHSKLDLVDAGYRTWEDAEEYAELVISR
jgi:hypothetical protein